MIAALLTLFALSAEARSMKASLDADIISHRFDPRSPLSELEITHSKVSVDFINDTIKLQFTLPWSCPPNALCAMVMPMRFFEVANMVVEQDECGATQYIAEEDDRPVDGFFQRIVVTDLTTSTCPQPMIYPAIDTTINYTVKFYDRINGEEVELKHYFRAEELR